MARTDASGRLTGLDTARGIAILGMIATHLYPLLMTDTQGTVSPTWVGMSLTGVSSALFVVLAGIGLSLLTRKSPSLTTSRLQLTIRAVVLIFIGLLLGHAGSNVAIILVHYGFMFLIAMWFIGLSRKALTITALSWIIIAPWFHGMLTRFMQLQAGGTTTYVEQWRLWTSPTLMDLIRQPLLTLWDLFFTGYYPVISFLGYVLIGMVIGRMRLAKATSALRLVAIGAVSYVGGRGLGFWFLTDASFVQQLAHETGTSADAVTALATTGAGINTDLVMGAPEWYRLAVPHSGAPLDIYSTVGAALVAVGVCLLIAKLRLFRAIVMPLTATGMVALTTYTAHVLLTGMWRRDWPAMIALGDPVWESMWWMLIVHWVMVIAIGMIVYLLGVRGPLEAVLRRLSNA